MRDYGTDITYLLAKKTGYAKGNAKLAAEGREVASTACLEAYRKPTVEVREETSTACLEADSKPASCLDLGQPSIIPHLFKQQTYASSPPP
jgi:hypothetical protein